MRHRTWNVTGTCMYPFAHQRPNVSRRRCFQHWGNFYCKSGCGHAGNLTAHALPTATVQDNRLACMAAMPPPSRLACRYLAGPVAGKLPGPILCSGWPSAASSRWQAARAQPVQWMALGCAAMLLNLRGRSAQERHAWCAPQGTETRGVERCCAMHCACCSEPTREEARAAAVLDCFRIRCNICAILSGAPVPPVCACMLGPGGVSAALRL